MKNGLFILIFLLSVQSTFGQTTLVVKGSIIDSASAQPLPGATISVFQENDSSLVSSTFSSLTGSFGINLTNSGKYIFKITHQGYESKFFSIQVDSLSIDLGIIKLQKEYKTLTEVIIKDQAPVRVKGDTVIYNADVYKTKPNASVEDLLKKLPGVQVDRSGAVKAQGEEVQKIYVDGKEYFGDDPQQATKNLTADMIEQVQMFDDKSEQSKFSGIDDGSRSKAINLKLKKEKKTGATGKAFLGYGTGNHYNAGVNANYFKGASQLSLNASSNNINNLDYTTAETDVNGISRTTSAGINYRDTWNKNFDYSGSYIFRNSKSVNLRQIQRQSFLPGSTLFTSRQSDFNNTNSEHRINQKIIYLIDSMNSIIYMPGLNIGNSFSTNSNTLVDMMYNQAFSYKSSENLALHNIDGSRYNLINNLIWRRKFNRRGRTFSASFSDIRNLNKRDNLSLIDAQFFDSTGRAIGQRIGNLKTGNKNKTGNYGFTFSYTEPLSKSGMIEVNYNHGKNINFSGRNTLSYNNLTTEFDIINDSLSNEFQQVNNYNRIGANFREVKKNYNYQVGISFQQSVLDNEDKSKSIILNQQLFNIIPTAAFNYQIARNKSFRFNYRGRNNQPNALQLQDVADVSDYPFIRRGNPDLKQEFLHNLLITYNSFNTAKLHNVFATLFLYNTSNKIVNAIEFKDGEQIITPVNLNGVYSINGSIGHGFPIKRMEGGNISTTTRFGYIQGAGMINNNKNLTKNLLVGEEVKLSFNYKEKLDISLNAGLLFNAVNHTVHKEQNQSYFTHNYAVDLYYLFKEDLSFSTIFDFTGYTGRDTDLNGNFVRWNAGITKQVLENRGELTLSVHNILNQNNSIERLVYDNIIEDIRNTAQKRFAMVTFRYNLNFLNRKASTVK